MITKYDSKTLKCNKLNIFLQGLFCHCWTDCRWHRKLVEVHLRCLSGKYVCLEKGIWLETEENCLKWWISLQKYQLIWLETKLPFLVTQVSDVHIEQGQKRRSAKGARAIEVGVVGCPTSHDLFIIHQTLTGITAWTTGHTHLESQSKLVSQSNLNIRVIQSKKNSLQWRNSAWTEWGWNQNTCLRSAELSLSSMDLKDKTKVTLCGKRRFEDDVFHQRTIFSKNKSHFKVIACRDYEC